MSEQNAFSLYLNNKPGVLNRVGLVFSRRGWNIESISISPAEDGRYARCTLMAAGPGDGLANLVAQLNKLVDVIAARSEVLGGHLVAREVALVKVRFDQGALSDVAEAARELHCELVDTSGGSAIFQCVGGHSAVDGVRAELGKRFEVLDVVRSGAITMHRAENDADDISNVAPGIVVTAEEDGQIKGFAG